MTASASPDWTKARNVLAVRLDSMGDVLMTTPALRALKEAVPGRKLTLLTSSSGAALAPLLPFVDSTLTYAAPWMKAARGAMGPKEDMAFLRTLTDERFDAAAIFTVFSQSPLPAATFCALAGIPLRAAHCRENPYALLTDWIREREPETGIRHEVQRHLDFVTALGAPVRDERIVIQVPASAQRDVQRRLHKALGPRQSRMIVIHPGATAASRRYPIELFAEVACRLTQLGYAVVVTGSADEQPLAETIAARCEGTAISLCGQLSLGELGALLQTAPLLISNNTGPVHLAAAVGAPVVDLYALTNPQHTPWRVPHRVLSHEVPCRDCFKSVCPEGHHDCLRRVPPHAVVHAALELLAEARGETPAASKPLAFPV